MGVDPLAEMYAGWSPYNYVMGNPIGMIDPDGRSATDIIYLYMKNAPFGYPISGHSAVLIGNDKTGYRFFNVSGNNQPNGNAEVNTNTDPIYDLKQFNTEYNAGNPNYEIGYRVETSEQADADMIRVAEQRESAGPYDLNDANCADFVRQLVYTGGVEIGDIQKNATITWPKDEFKEFVNANPSGTFELFGDNSMKIGNELGLDVNVNNSNFNYKVSTNERKFTATDNGKQ